MDLLNCNTKKVYFKFLLAAFGSALITSIYGIVDMAMVGQYYGPIGSSSIAIVAPIWNIIYSLGLLIGIGSSILFSICKGENKKNPNIYFTSAIFYGIVISIALYLMVWLQEDNLLHLFGGDAETIPLAKEYLLPVKFTIPFFVFSQIFASFLRNDNNPHLATISVVAGGVINVFGDYFFVFVLNMGIMGAGLATCLCSIISVITMSVHFFQKKNTLKLVKSKEIFKPFFGIFKNGFPSFIVDLAMGILTIFYNRQIAKYFNNDVLSVYSIIINISTLAQCCSYGIGEAAQPIVSQNFGAKKLKRVNEVLRYLIFTSFVLGLIWMIISMSMPNVVVRIFMKPTDNVLMIAPKIIRLYAISFILLPLNVASTFYFQSILKSNISLVISIARGILISGICVYLLPLINKNLIWLAMPIAETLVSIFVFFNIIKFKKEQKNINNPA